MSTAKSSRKFPYTPCPHTCSPYLTVNIPHQSGAIATIEEPTLTHHYHLKPIVYLLSWASLVAQMVKNLPALWETGVWSLDLEDPLQKEMATHSSILAWKISWTEEPGGLQLMGLQRVGHDWVTNTFTFIYYYSIIHNSFTASKSFVSPIHHSLPPYPWQQLIFLLSS